MDLIHGTTIMTQTRVPRVRASARWSGGWRALHASRISLISLISLQLRYANNSNYKNDEIITREVFVNRAMLDEFKRIVVESDVSI